MSGLKRREPALTFGGYNITPDEIDRYEVYNIVGPGTNVSHYFLGTSGTANVTAMTLLNFTPDYPRNLQFSILGSSVGQAGSVDVNGRDQFGSSISETLGFGSTDNGGSVVGTRVFAQVANGTIRYGTFAGILGTSRLGFSLVGTTTLFGLPFKVAVTKDVVHIGAVGGTAAISANGGSAGSLVNVAMHAIKSPANVNGTMSIVVWATSKFDATNMGTVANGTQVT